MTKSKPSNIRVRFAPSPTGYLHLGNLRTALFNYLFARQQGGSLILRLDDTDMERSEEEFIQGIFEDLKFLGIDFDQGPFRQSERRALYEEKLDLLKSKGLVYPCFCSKETIENFRAKAKSQGRAYRYEGTCLSLSSSESQDKVAAGDPYILRFKVGEDNISFHDLVWGEKQFSGSEIGDFALTRSDGSPLYLFTSVVDDGDLKVSHVIRGEDGLSNTPRQLLLWKALGYSIPQTAHLPLILGSDRKLLSKRHGASSLRELRRQGYVKEAILNSLVLLGWAPPEGREVLTLEEMIGLFNLEKVARHAAVMDFEKLNFFNAHYLRTISEKSFLEQALPFVPPAFEAEGLDKKILHLRNNLHRLDELGDWLKVLEVFPDFHHKPWPEELKNQESLSLIQLAIRSLKSESFFEEEAFKVYLKDLQKSSSLKGKKLFMPLRLALTGQEHGPELVKVFQLFDSVALKERFQHAAKYLQQCVG
ncbi:MAG: glutamate--tRNA ligase [Deltaproteobacteria bacterium]|nr:glutamate--tRNA ligase [Deltaproteobacteria bacterium]